MLVTTGGASVGEHDLVQDALTDIGLELDFWQIAMRPGKPLMFGRLGDVPARGRALQHQQRACEVEDACWQAYGVNQSKVLIGFKRAPGTGADNHERYGHCQQVAGGQRFPGQIGRYCQYVCHQPGGQQRDQNTACQTKRAHRRERGPEQR